MALLQASSTVSGSLPAGPDAHSVDIRASFRSEFGVERIGLYSTGETDTKALCTLSDAE